MSILSFEGFREYTANTDLTRGGLRINTPSGIALTQSVAALGGATCIRPPVNATACPNALLETPLQHVAMSVDLLTGGTLSSVEFQAGFCAPNYYARNSTSTSSDPMQSVYLKTTGGVPRLYYDIATAATGTAKNSLLLATLPTLAVNTAYHLELEVDHRNPVAVCRVWINGSLQAEVSYNRDRLLNGFEANTLASVGLGGALAAGFGGFANWVIYTPDANTPAPLGPMTVDYLAASNVTLSVGPAVDADGLTLNNTAWQTLTLSDTTVVDADVLDVRPVYRLAASGGQDPATAEFALESGGAQIGSTLSHAVTPGMAATLHRPSFGKLTQAQLNGASLKFRSAV